MSTKQRRKEKKESLSNEQVQGHFSIFSRQIIENQVFHSFRNILRRFN